MADGEVTLFPVWKQAVADFLVAEFKAGDLLPHTWLEAHFNMGRLDDDATLTGQEYRERQFMWLSNVEAFKVELLERHQIYLASVFGQGYRWVPPHEQTSVTVDKFRREAQRIYRQAAGGLTHIRLEELTDEQRKLNYDATAKLSMLRGMHRDALK